VVAWQSSAKKDGVIRQAHGISATLGGIPMIHGPSAGCHSFLAVLGEIYCSHPHPHTPSSVSSLLWRPHPGLFSPGHCLAAAFKGKLQAGRQTEGQRRMTVVKMISAFPKLMCSVNTSLSFSRWEAGPIPSLCADRVHKWGAAPFWGLSLPQSCWRRSLSHHLSTRQWVLRSCRA
jgi:hypothetical protein